MEHYSIRSVYQNGEHKYFFYDGDFEWGEMVRNFDWKQLELGAICEFQGDKYTITQIYDHKEYEELEMIVYVLKPIYANILIGLKD